MLSDGARHAASGNDVGFAVKGGQQLVDKPINHGCSAVNDAALHTLEGVATNQMLRLLDGDGGQLRGASAQSVHRGFNAGDDDATAEHPVFVDNADGGSCAKIDDDGGHTIAAGSADGVGQSVFTQLGGRFYIYRDNALGIGR